MTTSVWPTQKWFDEKLKWNPDDFAGIEMIRTPSSFVWLPDIGLFNNVDGNFDVSYYSNVLIGFQGDIAWVPPSICKTSCRIEIDYFPYDEQQCPMTFKSMTYNSDLLEIRSAQLQAILDSNSYWPNAEWSIVAIPSSVVRNKSLPGLTEAYDEITFTFNIRRRPLYYNVNLMLPIMIMTLMVVVGFYLPSDSGERLVLCMSTLLADTMLLLIVVKNFVPATSHGVPLICQFLMFTMMMLTSTIVSTVIVLNIRHRSRATHNLPKWVRRLFIGLLPSIIRVQRPQARKDMLRRRTMRHNRLRQGFELRELLGRRPRSRDSYMVRDASELSDCKLLASEECVCITEDEMNNCDRSHHHIIPEQRPDESDAAFESLAFIVNRLRRLDNDKLVREDWMYVALVVDRVLLWLYLIAVCTGITAIFVKTPYSLV